MQLFYQPLLSENHFELDAEESKHCVRVLRKTEGDLINLIDGKGIFYEGRITQANPKKCAFDIVHQWPEPQRNYHIHMAVAPTKNADRLEWFIEKAVEIGVDEISLLLTDNSERKKLRTDRLERKAISAVKQSVKASVPVIHELTHFKDFLSDTKSAPNKYLAYVSDTPIPMLHQLAQPGQSYIMLIGPEGDFSSEEIEAAQNHQFQMVNLGPSRLRTETAALTACHTLNLINW